MPLSAALNDPKIALNYPKIALNGIPVLETN